MSIVQDPSDPTLQAKVDGPRKALRTAPQPIAGTGHYTLAASTGLVTAVVAGTATLGHLAAFRWGSSTHLAIVTRHMARWTTTTGFGGAQEMQIKAFRATGFSTLHTGGTLLSKGSPNLKRRTDFADTQLGNFRIATTGELTAGTHTLDAVELCAGSYAELAAAATVQKGWFLLGRTWGPGEQPLVLRADEGIIWRNEIGMGAGGVGRLFVEVDWTEILIADYPGS